MAKIELIMPKMGESIIEATILKWSKQVGEEIEAEETVLEIATDKVDSEVPSPTDGVLAEILFEEGAVVPVGEVIAIIESEGGSVAASPAVEKIALSGNGKHVESTPVAEKVAEVPFVPAGGTTLSAQPVEGRFYSPLVLNIARKEGISMGELERIPGSGREGRVTKKDILGFVKTRVEAPVSTPVAKPAAPKTQAPKATAPAATVGGMKEKKFTHSGNYEIVEMTRMRKMIADNMVYSKHVSAHVTSFVEADVTNLVMWRNRVKDDFQNQFGEKLTYTPLFLLAVIKALREHPMINSSVDGTNILVKKEINLGVAVALPTDNLIVPVIKNADHLNLQGLTAKLNDLAKRARENKLKPDELEGGTYTVSNVGTFGNVMGTPVILQPQVAILATGAIRKLPAVVETPEGDMIAIRHKMFLSHSYDHRIVDGALGGRFVRRVGDLLEAWDPNTSF